jgi:F0F1-type ATP synthase assembly protein I
MIVFFVLGTAAGIRNVMRAANEINAEVARSQANQEKKVP